MKQIQLIGNIGKDAETRIENGNKFTTFTLAVNESYKDQSGNKVENTTWFSCLTRQEKLVPYLKKGTKVFVQGSFNCKVYRSEIDGAYKAALNVSVDTIELLGGGTPVQQTGTAPQAPATPVQPTETSVPNQESDDLPF